MNFEFMTIDTPLPPCMPFPIALTGFPVSSTAKVMYCRMLDAMLSKGQEDENGTQYFVCGKNRIKISEHFAAGGRPIGDLIVDVVRHTAARAASS